jgi:hypothetical protein
VSTSATAPTAGQARCYFRVTVEQDSKLFPKISDSFQAGAHEVEISEVAAIPSAVMAVLDTATQPAFTKSVVGESLAGSAGQARG